MENFSDGLLLMLFLSSMVVFPCIGIVLGAISLFPLGYSWELSKYFFDSFIKQFDFRVTDVECQRNSMVIYAAETGLKFLYLLGAIICIPVLLILGLAAELAFFGPLIAGVSFFWTFAPVSMSVLLIATAVFIVAYVAIILLVVFRKRLTVGDYEQS